MIDHEISFHYFLEDDHKEDINYIMGTDVFDKSFKMAYDRLIAIEMLNEIFHAMGPDGVDFNRERVEAHMLVVEDFIPLKHQHRLAEVYLRKLGEMR